MLYIEITITEKLDPQWSDWFDGLDIQAIAEDRTILRGMLADQSAVYGIVSRIAGLGMTLVTVNVSKKGKENG